MEQRVEHIKAWELLKRFLLVIQEDPRINVFHINLYLALLQIWEEQQCKSPLSVFSHQVIKLTKISSPATYHKCLRSLHAYGYIEYLPSFDHSSGSQIYFLSISVVELKKSCAG